jgi:hypothetical protein
MTPGVHDFDAIRARRIELFGTPQKQIDTEAPPPFVQGGSAAGSHCALCPKAPDEPCMVNCRAEYDKKYPAPVDNSAQDPEYFCC